MKGTDSIGVKAYEVLPDGELVGTVLATPSTPPVTVFSNTALAARTLYEYRVVARDAQENRSRASATASARRL